ncbi:ATP-dependent zinc metalloprotease FtsH [Lactococcus nasutitermitis]|uniref:ATP-dependent zinc metalloprotease FtsH n=1 Tax=Lactococcus nasutitermitis TaxID=1652957 RepID=A0ABV9JAA4_9LACT|nr:ATP-dependent zinc metalloprotease FtsH [Lactococcus nasutitermitis]
MNNNNRKNGGIVRNTFMWILLAIVVVIGINWFVSNNHSNVDKISYSSLMTKLKDGDIKTVTMQPSDSLLTVTGEYTHPKKVETNSVIGNTTQEVTHFQSYVIPTDTVVKTLQNTASDKDVKVNVIQASSSGMWLSLLSPILTIIVMVGIFWLLMGGMGSRGGGGAGNPMSFGKSRAKQQDAKTSKVRFADVAGSEEEKQELVEVVDFLKNPKKYHDLGARIPAGVLLEGPPGTGKTLLAKAVAGEAGVPFYSISGSDFVEMFVGVGASRVRDLFENAKKTAPSIVFIDEIDAVGRQRGAGLGGGNDEREQTLNQLLVEMDGFQDNNDSVIVIAATNRSDVLDPALLRPGRFDRKVLVGAPDVKGREAVLRVHAKNKPFSDDVDLAVVAQQTPGFVGADLENVLNEAALVAARRNKTVIDASDIDEAEDRVIAGPAKKDKKVSEKERETVAYHEAGHTIVGLVLSNANTVHKVTIVPRGRAGGYMIALPKEDQFLLSKEDMMENLAGLMGGRTAEEVIYGRITTGASNDFEQATRIARGMVTQYGMSDKLGPISYEGDHAVFIGRDYGQTKTYSEATAVAIDEEVRSIVAEAHEQAREIIESHREQHKAIAMALLKYETLDARQIMSLYKTGKMPNEVTSDETLEPKDFEQTLADKNDFTNINIFKDEKSENDDEVSENPNSETNQSENPEN